MTHSLREIAEAAEASVALSVATAAIALLPFRAIVRTIGSGAGPAAVAEAEVVAAIRRAVQRASRRLPWRIVCFHEALAAHWMLRRRGCASSVHYGLRQGEERLTAHVWVTVAGQIVIGEERTDPHACIAVFPAD